jgi:hypothetical protein
VAEIIHSSDNITTAQAVLILEQNCHFDPLVQKLGRLKRSVTDMGELMNALTKYAESDSTKDPGTDEVPNGKGKKGNGGKGHQQNNVGNGGKRKNPEGGSDLVANTNAGYKYPKKNGGRKKFKPKNFKEALKGPCPKHSLPNKPTTHSWEDCSIMRAYSHCFQNHQGGGGGDPGSTGGSSSGGYHQQSYQGPGGSGGNYQEHGGNNQQPGNQQQGNQSGYQSNPKQLNGGQYHVFTTNTDRRDRKLKRRLINMVEPAAPQYLRWSEYPITWSREDHPPRVDNLGHLALVVAPQVGGYSLTKVLMDGGSSINILYYDTFRRKGLSEKDLSPSTPVFHGIVPGKSAYPVGWV